MVIYLVGRRYQAAVLERRVERRREDEALLEPTGGTPEVARV
jgi:hypothetical protein